MLQDITFLILGAILGAVLGVVFPAFIERLRKSYVTRKKLERKEALNNTTLTGTPVIRRNDSQIVFNWGYNAPAAGINKDNFSVRWVKQDFFAGGSYVFSTRHDDGMRVYLDGNLIHDHWKAQSARSHNFIYSISAGFHTIRIDYYEAKGRAEASIIWRKQ